MIKEKEKMILIGVTCHHLKKFVRICKLANLYKLIVSGAKSIVGRTNVKNGITQRPEGIRNVIIKTISKERKLEFYLINSLNT